MIRIILCLIGILHTTGCRLSELPSPSPGYIKNPSFEDTWFDCVQEVLNSTEFKVTLSTLLKSVQKDKHYQVYSVLTDSFTLRCIVKKMLSEKRGGE